MSHLNLSILAFPTNLVPLFDCNLWVFENSPKLTYQSTFVYSKCKLSSLRSQCWMRLFWRFSNTVPFVQFAYAWSFLAHCPCSTICKYGLVEAFISQCFSAFFGLFGLFGHWNIHSTWELPLKWKKVTSSMEKMMSPWRKETFSVLLN